MGAFAQAPMRSRRPAVRVRYGAAHQADGSTQRQQPTRQAYGESDPTGDATPILTGLRDRRIHPTNNLAGPNAYKGATDVPS
jgi:hypothetical protein